MEVSKHIKAVIIFTTDITVSLHTRLNLKYQSTGHLTLKSAVFFFMVIRCHFRYYIQSTTTPGMSRSVLLQIITYTFEVKHVLRVIFSIFFDTTENLGLKDAASKWTCIIDTACSMDMDTQHVPGH
jgi:hypothetical protein